MTNFSESLDDLETESEAGHLRSGAVTSAQALFFGLSGVGIPVIIQGFGGNMAFSAGNHAWLAALIALPIALLLGWIVIRFAGRHVVTGTLMSYVTLEVGPRLGVATGAALFIGYAAAAMMVTSITVIFLTSFLGSIGFPVVGNDAHAIMGLVVIAVCVYLARRGVTLSVKTAIALGWVGAPLILCILIGAIYQNGVQPAPQLDFTDFSSGPFLTGVILAFGMFNGFEGFTALAHETEDPRRTMPRLILIVLLAIGGALLISAVLTSPLMAVGIQSLLDGASPLSVLAEAAHLPTLGIFADALLCLATMGSLLVYINDAGRIIGTAAKDGILPVGLSKIDDRTQTPSRATIFIGALGATGYVGYLLVAQAPIFTVFLAFAVFLTYAWTIAYILLTVAGVASAVRDRDPLFAAGSALAGIACTATLIIPLLQSQLSDRLPWICVGLVAVLTLLGWRRIREMRPDPSAEML